MWVGAVRSGRCVLQVDNQCVTLLSHQQRSEVTQPFCFCQLRPVGGVAVLLINSLLVG